jgi:23S rRNA (uridine2552-2'-O)-methyltransferase
MNKNPYKRPDRFTVAAKEQGYEARSVFKLSDIQDKTKILRPGDRVVDLGCFPGSWSRYALERIGPKGKLVGVDLEAPTLGGGVFLARSVYDVTPEELRELLGGPADVVLSDMAPKTSGIADRDHYVQMDLVRRALEIAEALLAPGGRFVAKIFDGEETKSFHDAARVRFDEVKRVRPEAVRKVSREFFWVGLGYSAPSGPLEG